MLNTFIAHQSPVPSNLLGFGIELIKCFLILFQDDSVRVYTLSRWDILCYRIISSGSRGRAESEVIHSEQYID